MFLGEGKCVKGDNVREQVSTCISKLEEAYCQSRAAVTSEVYTSDFNTFSSSSSSGRASKIINGGKKAVYTFATMAMLNANLTQYARAADITVSAGETMSGVALDQYNSSATMDVYGTVNKVGIYLGGIQNVYSGGIVNNVTMGGRYPTTQIVYSGGTVNNGILGYDTSQIVYSGGIVNNITVSAQARQYLRNGSAYGGRIASNGMQILTDNAYASGVVLDKGFQYVSSGTSADGTVIMSEDTLQILFEGGVASNTHISSGGSQFLNSGAIASGTHISSGGIQIVENASAVGTVISSGGSNELNGFTPIATSTTVHSGGTHAFTPGASSFDINLMKGGILSTFVMPGGGLYITGVNAETGTSFSISNGLVSNFILYSGADLLLASSGVWASNTTIDSGGVHVVDYDTSSLDITLKSGGMLSTYITSSYMYVKITGINEETGGAFSASNGVADNFIVYSGGMMALNGGATANNTIISSGGFQSIKGATINNTYVDSGARLSLDADFTATDLQIRSGAQLGIQISSTSNKLTGSNLDNGSSFYVSNGKASGFELYSGGSMTVISNISAIGTKVYDGARMYVARSGYATDTILESGGYLSVDSYGRALNITQNEGTIIRTTVGQYGPGIVVSGSNAVTGSSFRLSANSASGFVLYSGADQYIYGGYATDTTITNGGHQYIASGSSLNITQHSGGTIRTGVYANVLVTGFNTETGKSFYISSGTADNMVLYSGAFFDIGSGFSASNTIISNGSYLLLNNTAKATNTVVGSSGFFQIAGNASALNVTQHAGAAIDTTLGSSLSGTVTGFNTDTNTSFSISNGVASNFVVYEGGSHMISAGGESINLTNSGGSITVLEGAVVDNYKATGGALYLSAGAKLINTDGYLKGDTTFWGGTVDLTGKSTPAHITFDNMLASLGVNFNIDGNMDTLSMDKISVVSKFEGNATIKINNTALTAANPAGNGVKIVEFAPGAHIEGTVYLIGGKWDESGYEYFLKQGTVDGEGFDYYLRTNLFYTDVFKTMLNIPLLNSVMARSGMNSLQRRLGDLRNMNNPANKQGVWARTYYKDLKVSDLIDTDMDLFGVEAGYDWLFTPEAPNKLFAGVMIGYMDARNIKTKHDEGYYSTGKGDAPSVGVYATLLNDDKWFVDIAARNFWTKLDMKNHSASGSELKFKPKRNLTAVSLEAGKEFTTTLSRRSFLRIEPKAEVTYMRASSNNTDVENGTDRLSYESANYLSTQAGILIGFKKERANGLLIEPLIELAYRYEFNGKGDVSYGGATHESTLKGGYLETKLGFDMQLTKDLYWYSLAGYEYGSKIKGWGLNAGIRLGFGGGKKADQASPIEKLKQIKETPPVAQAQQPAQNLNKELKTVAAVKETPTGAKVSFDRPILFNYGSDALTQESDKEIEKITDILKKYPTATVVVEGYTDSRGSAEFNQKLSERRAQSVAEAIKEDGIAAERVSFKGYGLQNPIADNATKEGRAKNRRVELDIKLK